MPKEDEVEFIGLLRNWPSLNWSNFVDIDRYFILDPSISFSLNFIYLFYLSFILSSIPHNIISYIKKMKQKYMWTINALFSAKLLSNIAPICLLILITCAVFSWTLVFLERRWFILVTMVKIHTHTVLLIVFSVKTLVLSVFWHFVLLLRKEDAERLFICRLHEIQLFIHS